MATPPTFPISTASFTSNTFTFDPLYASETISQSATIAPSQGVLKRGTVLCGPLPGLPITQSTQLTTVVTGANARVILAQDIDTGTGAGVTGLVYTQGKFLDTAMIFTSQGAAIDVAQLRQFGIYVLTVEQRSGLLVPLMKLPATGGPLPQTLSAKDAIQATREQAEAIKAAVDAFRVDPAPPPLGQLLPAWAIAAFGEPKPTPLQEAREKAAEAGGELAKEQSKALSDLEAKQAQERGALLHKQAEERAQLAKQTSEAVAVATPPPAPHTPPVAPVPPHTPPTTPPKP